MTTTEDVDLQVNVTRFESPALGKNGSESDDSASTADASSTNQDNNNHTESMNTDLGVNVTRFDRKIV